MDKALFEPEIKAESKELPDSKPSFGYFLVNGGISIGLLLLGFTLGNRYQPEVKTNVRPTSTVSPRVLTVETTQIRPVSGHSISRSYTGETSTARESSLGFERAGKVNQLLVDEGDYLYKDQVIAKLDIRQLEMQKLNLEAQKDKEKAILAELVTGARQEDIAGAKATVKQLKEKLSLEDIRQERRQYLYQAGAISREQLDEVSFNRNALTAQLQEAQSRLDELLAGTRIEQINAQKAVIQQLEVSIQEIDLDIYKSVLKSPYNGLISQRLIDEGTVVSVGQALVKLIENGKPEVRIGIPTDKVNLFQKKSQYSVIIDQKNYPATVSAILPQVDSATRTQTLILSLDPSVASNVPRGAIARLNVRETVAISGFWLPTTALIRGDRGLWSCYAVIKDNKKEEIVEKRDIEVLYTENNRVLVRGTLNEGDLIITQGTQRMVPGQIVISE